MNKSQCIKQLKEGRVNISFLKANNETRIMEATINPDLIPETERQDEDDESTSKGPKNPDVQVVWDIDKGAWRSFKWDRLIDHYPLG